MALAAAPPQPPPPQYSPGTEVHLLDRVAVLYRYRRISGAVFVLTGVQGAAISISNLSVLLEFAPVPEEQPTYVGLGTTLMAPVALGAPLAAGLLADAFGFATVFAIAAAAGTVALALLVSLVRDPRETRSSGFTGRASPGDTK